MEWMLLPYRRYADFSGRSRRREYWMFALFYMLVIAALLFIAIFTGMPMSDEEVPQMSSAGVVAMVLLALFALGSIVPALAVQVRRFHDQDKSGWLILLNFIPYIGGFIVLVFMCLEGTRGENSYGSDPKGLGPAETFS